MISTTEKVVHNEKYYSIYICIYLCVCVLLPAAFCATNSTECNVVSGGPCVSGELLYICRH